MQHNIQRRLPWRTMMEITFGALGFPPEIFWAMTPPEWLAALDGWKKRHGFAAISSHTALRRSELNEMIRKFG